MQTEYHHSISNGLVLDVYSNFIEVLIVNDDDDVCFQHRASFEQFSAAVLNDIPHLNEIFNWVRVYACSTGFTLVPSKIDDAEERRMLYASQHPLSAETQLMDVALRNDMDLLFTMPTTVLDSFKQKFPSLSVHHQAERFVKHLHGQLVNRQLQLFVGGELDNMLLAVYHSKGLEFLNSFACTDGNDAFYFVMLVIEQLDLAPEYLELHWLMNEENMAHAEVESLFKPYVRELHFHSNKVVTV